MGEILFKFKQFGKMKKKCVTKANQKGVTVFGLDDTRCWAGHNAASSYGIYGIIMELLQGVAPSKAVYVMGSCHQKQLFTKRKEVN